jgi:hypothetical protein
MTISSLTMGKAMATKIKEKLLYPEKEFQVAQLNFCCGIGEVGSFQDEEDRYDWNWNGPRQLISKAKKKYATREQQAEACYQEILSETCTGGYDGEYYSQLLISLVSNYGPDSDQEKRGTAQYPELEEILLREGWTIYSVFINPNHGNEVTLYGKYFPDRTKHPDDEEE